jgi:hypothetical protein
MTKSTVYNKILRSMDDNWGKVYDLDKSDHELLSAIEAVRTILENRLIVCIKFDK